MKWQINNIQRDIESASGGLGVKQTLPSRLAPLLPSEEGKGAEAGKKVKATDKAKRDDEVSIYRDWVTEAQREARDTSAEEEKKRRPVSSRKSPDLSGLEELSKIDRFASNRRKELDSELKEDVAAKAREILAEHKTFASFEEDKFNRHMRAAEEYLKRGRYYRAADAYTIASIYKSDDPLAHAGKSHALFAAGEYMSSALFLSRALEIFPEYAQFKIDLVAMVGDKDKLESRIANVEEWLDESDAPELKFLLGYIYYQMERNEEAEKMTYEAFRKMPESKAVAALKKAITSSLRPYGRVDDAAE